MVGLERWGHFKINQSISVRLFLNSTNDIRFVFLTAPCFNKFDIVYFCALIGKCPMCEEGWGLLSPTAITSFVLSVSRCVVACVPPPLSDSESMCSLFLLCCRPRSRQFPASEKSRFTRTRIGCQSIILDFRERPLNKKKTIKNPHHN